MSGQEDVAQLVRPDGVVLGKCERYSFDADWAAALADETHDLASVEPLDRDLADAVVDLAEDDLGTQGGDETARLPGDLVGETVLSRDRPVCLPLPGKVVSSGT